MCPIACHIEFQSKMDLLGTDDARHIRFRIACACLWTIGLEMGSNTRGQSLDPKLSARASFARGYQDRYKHAGPAPHRLDSPDAIPSMGRREWNENERPLIA